VLGLPFRFRHRAVRLGAAIALACMGSAASAQEQLIMPYSCWLDGGRVSLRPAQDQAYRIYGEHEQRPYTVCSPINPSLCRTWMLHRFALDCGGARVDWLSVAEAASDQTTGRAWVEDGRMMLRMNPYWNRDAGFDNEPCPRWRRRGSFDDCGDRGSRRPRGGVVEMPPGFAPAFGLQVRFARAELPPQMSDYGSGGAMAGSGAGSMGAVGKTPPAKQTRNDPVGDIIVKDAPVKSGQVAGATSGVQKSASEKSAGDKVVGKAPDAAVEATGQAKAKRTEAVRDIASEPLASGSVSVVPKIINRPNPTTGGGASATNSTGESADAKAPAVRTIPLPDPVTLTKVAEAATRSDPAASAGAAAGGASANTFVPSAATQAMIGFAALVAAALALFVWTRRREQMSLAAAGVREFGNVSFEGRPRRGAHSTAALPAPRATRGASQQRPPPIRPTSVTPATFPVADSRIPATREEACRVLGASLDASEAAIRKIVDGLRQSWHPDLATSEPDRRLREQRSKQINVAWDILSERPPVA
jgi:hypothetical protein